MKLNLKQIAIAGIVGTLAFDLVGLLITGQWWDIPGLLSGKLGIGLAGGVIGHYGNGLILAVIYAAVAPSLWGSSLARALTYITVQTIFGVWLFMLPLLGMGFAGLEASAMIPVITLVRHWAYGLVLAYAITLPEAHIQESVEQARTSAAA
jgi:hypothetical protein